MPRRLKILLFIAAAGVLIGAALYLFRPSSPFSNDIKRQVSFVILYPGSSQNYKVDKSTIKFSPATKLLSFQATGPSQTLSVTEQPEPDQINDIPGYLPKLTQLLNTYTTFGSDNGTAYLTHPTELRGQQSALFIGKGTMIFAHPSKNMSDDQWRQFFNSFDVAR
jgi:hypothetical protein